MMVLFQSVIAAWRPWNTKFEGDVSWMYPDTLGLVTTAMGNLLATVSAAVALPWVLADGSPATEDQIEAEYARCYKNMALARAGAFITRRSATLFLPSDAEAQLIGTTLEADAEQLSQHIPDDDPGIVQWPADAQLGIMSMCWAMGPGFIRGFPHFAACVERMDFAGAALQCAMQDAGGGIDWRNAATKQAFVIADAVVKGGFNFSALRSPIPPVPLPSAGAAPEAPAPATAHASDALNNDPARTGVTD